MYRVPQSVVEIRQKIMDVFGSEIKKLKNSKPKRFRGWHRLMWLLEGEDTYQQAVKPVSRGKVWPVGCSGDAVEEWVMDCLMWYSLCFPITTAKLSLIPTPKEMENAVWSSRLGPILEAKTNPRGIRVNTDK